jgi:hypothetical protein
VLWRERCSRTHLLDSKPCRIGLSILPDRYPDVELGDRHVQSKVGEERHGLADIRRRLTSDEVRFKADTVEGCALGKKLLGDLDIGERLVVGRFDIVIVDVQLDIGCGCVGDFELMSAKPTLYSLRYAGNLRQGDCTRLTRGTFRCRIALP